MNTPNKNSHTDKTKSRRYVFAQKEGKDYSCVKIVEGKFKDVIYHYGRVAFAPESEKLPDGTKVFGKSINTEPEKYFTKEVLGKIDEYTKQKFTYGTDEE